MIEIYRKIKLLIGPRDRRRLHLLQVAVLFLAVFEMSAIGLIAPFMSMMMQPEILETNKYIGYLWSFSGISDPGQFVVTFGILVFVLYVFTNLYLVGVNWLVIHFSLTQGYKISTRLFSSYLAQNYLFFIKHNSAELSRVIFQDVTRLTDGVITPFLMILSRGTSAIAIITLLSIVDLRITLAAAVIFGLCYGFIYLSIRRLLVRIGERFSFYNNQRFRVVSEALGGIKDCKIYGAEGYFIDSYRDSSIDDANNQIKRRVLLFVPKYLIESVAIGGLLIVSLVFYSRGLSSQLISTIAIFAIAAYRLMPSLQQMYSDFSQIKTNRNALDLILRNFESVSTEDMAGSEALPPAHAAGKIISVEDLSFAYPGSEHHVLRDVSLEISPRTIVGFCGKSGSGKSTLIDVILGLHEYHHGNIHVDGELLTRRNVRSWQKRLGYVPQAIHLLDGTLAENVAFGIAREEIDHDRVWKVLKDAQLDAFVRSELPDGLNTYVGEKGVRLSGGQRQRIGIARALYRDPEVLVFDEATSALDGVTENLIIDTVCQLSGRMTVLMIAHRLSSLRFCDHVYYIVDGSVAQEGSYPKMLAECDYFSSTETARSD